MPWLESRLPLEVYQAELDSLVRIVLIDCEGDGPTVHVIVFTPAQGRLQMSPAELIRRGLMLEACEAARANYEQLHRKEPVNLMRLHRLHQRRKDFGG